MVLLNPLSALLGALVASIVSPSHVAQQQRVAPVHDVKAAFLYNFTRFVTWPAGIPPGSEPFRLCVVADRETTEAIGRTMIGETVNNRPAETRVPRTAEEIQLCQLLFVDEDGEARSKPLLEAARRLPVLIVGDGEEFPQRGGAIGFVVENGKLRFDIHARNAERGGLTISSRLLNVARRTDRDRQ